MKWHGHPGSRRAAEFWRLCRSLDRLPMSEEKWCANRELHPDYLGGSQTCSLLNTTRANGGATGNRTRTFAVRERHAALITMAPYRKSGGSGGIDSLRSGLRPTPSACPSALRSVSPTCRGFADRSLNPRARCHWLVRPQGFAPWPGRLKVCCAAVTPRPRANWCARSEVTLLERSARCGLQVFLKCFSPLPCLECTIPSEFPRNETGSVRGLTRIVAGKSGLQVCSGPEIETLRINFTLKDVNVIHVNWCRRKSPPPPSLRRGASP